MDMHSGNADATNLLTGIREMLRRGATRRQAIGWLASAGMGLATAGTVLTRARQALAETPRRGGSIRVAGYSSSTADTVDPAKQTLSTDYARCLMFYNGLTRLDETLHAATRARRKRSRTTRPPSGPSSCVRASPSMTARH